MLDRRKKYLQISINSDIFNAKQIIKDLPHDERIIVEAGTPFLKKYGVEGIKMLRKIWSGYIAADWKTIDRGSTEVSLTIEGGANAIIVMGSAPKETIETAIENAKKFNLDVYLDFMNVDNPLSILSSLRILPDVALIHRGVDETEKSLREKPLPFYEINRIKGRFEIMVGIAGGDTINEISSAIFNGADLVVVWKDFYLYDRDNTQKVTLEFLKEIR